MFEWWRKSFFSFFFNSSFIFTGLCCCCDLLSNWLIRDFAFETWVSSFSSLFFSMLLFLFFFFSLNSRLLLILLFHSPHFSGTVCTFRATLWQMNLEKENKTEQSIHNIRAYVWSCVENSIDNEQKNISKESIEKVLVLLSLTVLMKRTALEHTHNLCK